MLAADGSLDRRALRSASSPTPPSGRWLEQLTHPAIRELTDARSAAASGPYVMVAIPLLVETAGAKRFDRVLVVDCEPEVQLARLQARDGIHARARRSACSPPRRRARRGSRWRTT